jgi:hypothetical protein
MGSFDAQLWTRIETKKPGTANTEHSTSNFKGEKGFPRIQDDHGLSVICGRSEFAGE